MSKERFDSVWDALGDTPEEIENLRLRSSLMMTITKFVEELGVTQAEAASQLGISQPRLNDLLKGKIHKFSLDTLIKLIVRAGKHVELTVVDVERAA